MPLAINHSSDGALLIYATRPQNHIKIMKQANTTRLSSGMIVMRKSYSLQPTLLVKETVNGEVLFLVRQEGFWKPQLIVHSVKDGVKQKSFSIRPRGIFGVTFEVLDSDDSCLGAITLENVFTASWCIEDAILQKTYHLVRTSKFPYGEYIISLEEKIICTLIQKVKILNPEISLNLPKETPLLFTDKLILSASILLLHRQNNSGGA